MIEKSLFFPTEYWGNMSSIDNTASISVLWNPTFLIGVELNATPTTE